MDEPRTPAAGSPLPPPGPGPAPAPRVYRSRSDRMIAGVCGGLAKHFGVDPVLVRLAVVALTLLGGSGVLAYVIAWIVIPEEPEHRPPEPGGAPRRERRGPRFGTGLVFLVLGVIVVLPILSAMTWGMWGWHRWDRDGGDFLPALILLGIGAWLLFRPRRGGDAAPAGGAPWPPSTSTWSAASTTAATTTAVGSPGADVADEPTEPTTTDPTEPTTTDDTTPSAALDAGDTTEHEAAGDTATPSDGSGDPPWLTDWRQQDELPEPTPPEPEPEPRRRRSPVWGYVAGALLVGAGIFWLLGTAGAVDVDAADVLAGALLIVGLGVIASAWAGRSWGLMALGVVLAACLGGVSGIDTPIEGGFGERAWAPTTLSQLGREEPYRLIGGEAVLDLTSLDLGGDTIPIEASVTFGNLRVLVPADVAIDLTGEVTAGHIRSDFAEWQEGVSLEVFAERDAPEGSGTLVLDLRVGFGELEVFSG